MPRENDLVGDGKDEVRVKGWDAQGPSRRHFLKCAGGATASTVLTWQALSTMAQAGGQGGGSGGSGGSGGF